MIFHLDFHMKLQTLFDFLKQLQILLALQWIIMKATEYNNKVLIIYGFLTSLTINMTDLYENPNQFRLSNVSGFALLKQSIFVKEL